jgi:hypothetical protein
MVQREESRRNVMKRQSQQPEETRAFVIRQPKPNPNFDATDSGDQILLLKCSHCKREGHREEEYWFLHPELRSKGRGRGGRSYKNYRRQGELYEEPRREKRVLGAASEKADPTRTQIAPTPNQSNQPLQIGQPPSQDQMWQMVQHLTMMYNQNNSKNTRMTINFTSKFSQKMDS